MTKRFIHQIMSGILLLLVHIFNPTGAIQEYLLGESPNDIPNNPMFIMLPRLPQGSCSFACLWKYYGYTDGTGVRIIENHGRPCKRRFNAVNKVINQILWC